MSPLESLVQQFRAEHPEHHIPSFDPKNGNEEARFLFLLEAPGPQAIKTGVVSFDNPDETAFNLKRQLYRACIERSEIALWNIVPWYIGNSTKTKIRKPTGIEIRQGRQFIPRILLLMPKLECIVLVGSSARNAHVFLSHQTRVRILSCHHTSKTVLNIWPETAVENVAVFKHMLALHK